MEIPSLTELASLIPTEASAYEFMERLRWGSDQQVCPHCGSVASHYFLQPRNGVSRATRTGAQSERRVWKCRDCKRQFTVLVGTIFHRTKVPVRTWLFVLFEMSASKNGVSAREIERKYALTPRTAWFMTQRLREAMRREPTAGLLRGTVIADETFIGPNPRNFKKGKRFQADHYKREHKIPVLSLVSKESGEVRSQVVPNVTRETLRAAILRECDLADTDLQTDQSQPYIPIGWKARSHGRVNHAMSEYVRDGITTNHAEGFFAQLKRSLDGTHHAISREHLHRYLAEFDYRYTTRKMSDSQRMTDLARRTAGRRLTYRESPSEPSASSLVS